ncbi:hypothetical protein IGI04_039780 [Brassica rapa subsp. trilocularis]|uniref:RNase H type-1 domain-containing protein n=1 Tax=Brassica rapa subsp. trilocularis TaxID=1813537 RepID=A0ABQ7KLS5_BRACM|nr:hypothetical protein IGI04_039780 [Brassica rapa subsp. trilocularis]
MEAHLQSHAGSTEVRGANIQKVLPDDSIYYCKVDASWKNANEVGVEAEAQALLMAVQQIRRLGYKQVTFLSDCKPMVKELDQWKTVTTIKDSP